MPKTQREQILFLLIILSLGGLGLYYYMVYMPKSAEIATIEERLEKLNAANQKARTELGKGTVEELRAQAARYQQNLALMRQLVPTSNEVPALLEQISTAARRVGLDVSVVEPEAPIRGEAFDTYRYTLRLTGSYHELAAFLSNVGSLTRIVAPVDVKLAVQPANAKRGRARGDVEMIEAEFRVQTYVARTSTTPAPGA